MEKEIGIFFGEYWGILKYTILVKKKKEEANTLETDDLGTAINQSIMTKAIDLGFEKSVQ